MRACCIFGDCKSVLRSSCVSGGTVSDDSNVADGSGFNEIDGFDEGEAEGLFSAFSAFFLIFHGNFIPSFGFFFDGFFGGFFKRHGLPVVFVFLSTGPTLKEFMSEKIRKRIRLTFNVFNIKIKYAKDGLPSCKNLF